MNDLTFLPAVQMAEQIRHRKISPVELVEAHLRKIKKLNPVLNAFVQVDAEGAFRQAREAEVAVRRGAKLGALHGVPVSIKISIEVAGFRCEAGTKLRQGTVASQDAPLVSRLRDAGALVLGPMARKVQDLKLLFEVMQGPDIGDPSAVSVPVRWPDRDELKKVPIGYFEDDGRTPVTADTRAAVRTAAEALTRAGFQVEPFRPDGLELARQLWWKFFGIAGGMLLGPMTRGHEAELSPILKQFSSWVEAEPSHTGESLLDAWIQRDVIRMQVFAQMRDYPALLCPVAAIPAFKHGERSWQIDGKSVEYLDAWSYTEWFNLLGTPAAVVPVGQSPEGLPIGVQITARPWEEELVLSVAAELETQCGVWRAPVLQQRFSTL